MENYSNNGPSVHSVLVVNDLSGELETLNYALRKAGYRVFCAEDGQEAIASAKRVRPDLIIGDVTMPKVDGIEFYHLVRQDEELKTLPILLVSAPGSDTGVASGAGADEYLEIPFDSATLVAQATRLIERGRLEAALRNSDFSCSDPIARLRSMLFSSTDSASV